MVEVPIPSSAQSRRSEMREQSIGRDRWIHGCEQTRWVLSINNAFGRYGLRCGQPGLEGIGTSTLLIRAEYRWPGLQALWPEACSRAQSRRASPYSSFPGRSIGSGRHWRFSERSPDGSTRAVFSVGAR